MKAIHLIIFDKLKAAIAAKTPCTLHSNGEGVSLYNYQDRVGIHTRLDLYMPNYEDIDGTMGLRWIYLPYKKEEVEGGSLFITWDSLKEVSIKESSGRILIQLDDLVINFLEPIKT